MEDGASFGEVWRAICSIEGFGHVMLAAQAEQTRMAPLIVLRVPLLAAKKYLDAGKFNLRYSDPAQITQTADKLRWYRYQKALLQSDVADYLGIERTTYHHYESGSKEYYPIEHMEKLAVLYAVPVESLLDGYNRFLYDGQACRIRSCRESMGLGKKAFAEATRIPLRSLQTWESGRKQISKKAWQKYFKNLK